MAQMQVSDPERYDTKKVDTSGKLYVGRELSGKRIRFIIEDIEPGPDEDKGEDE